MIGIKAVKVKVKNKNILGCICFECIFINKENLCEHPDLTDKDYIKYCGPGYRNLNNDYIFIKSISNLLKEL